MLEKLMIKLERIDREIQICKKNLIKKIERERMIPASNDLLLMRDLKEQQLLIKRIIIELENERTESAKK